MYYYYYHNSIGRRVRKRNTKDIIIMMMIPVLGILIIIFQFIGFVEYTMTLVEENGDSKAMRCFSATENNLILITGNVQDSQY